MIPDLDPTTIALLALLALSFFANVVFVLEIVTLRETIDDHIDDLDKIAEDMGGDA